MFQCLGWMRKNFIPLNFSWSVAVETWDSSCFKKGLLEKQQSFPNTCTILLLAIEKNILSELNRCIFQIPLKYIKFVTPKILFILVLCNFSFYFKITWPLPPQKNIYIYNSHLHQNYNFWFHRAKTFLKFLTPSPKVDEGEGGRCMLWKLN